MWVENSELVSSSHRLVTERVFKLGVLQLVLLCYVIVINLVCSDELLNSVFFTSQ